ncbi:MAG TPA: zinc ribbon domain-containing protein [Sphingobium sp.]
MSSANPSSAPLDQPFWDGLDEGRLMISACVACAHWIWPPQWRCGECGGWEMAWHDVGKTGVVHSLTRTHHPFAPAMMGRTPFATLLVELPQAGGARLLGLVADDAGELAIGSAVTADIIGSPAMLRWRAAEGETA